MLLLENISFHFGKEYEGRVKIAVLIYFNLLSKNAFKSAIRDAWYAWINDSGHRFSMISIIFS